MKGTELTEHIVLQVQCDVRGSAKLPLALSPA